MTKCRQLKYIKWNCHHPLGKNIFRNTLRNLFIAYVKLIIFKFKNKYYKSQIRSYLNCLRTLTEIFGLCYYL